MASAGAQRGAARGGARFTTGEASADFPILCETCLGPNPYLRMIRCEYSKECNVCDRPMTSFRWKPGRDSRYKSTVVCQTCSKMKNVCQCCLFDLEYGLPVAVRDHYAKEDNVLRPASDVQREYFAQQHEVALASGAVAPYQSGTAKLATNPDLLKLSKKSPRYERNRPHICSFFVKGECRRGKECPYRHEMPDGDDQLSKQNMRDRFYGSNDPVADKIFRLQREKQQAQESARRIAAEAADAEDDFDPSTVPLPPGPPPTAGGPCFAAASPPPSAPSGPGLSIPAYPSTSSDWMGQQARSGR